MNTYFSEWHLTADGRRFLRLCVGGACQDIHLWVRDLNPGRKHPILDRFVTIGGGAANVARVHRRLAPATPVVLLAPVGDDREGLAVRRHMEEQHIQMPWAPVEGGATSTSYLIHAGAAGTVLSDPGVRAAPVPPGLLEQFMARAEACCLVAPSNGVIGPATRQAAARGVKVYFGLGSAQVNELGLGGLAKALEGPVELLMCNAPEASKLTGCDEVRTMLEALRGVGAIKHVVITDGAGGMHALSDGGFLRAEAYRDGRPVVDDVGAGDAAQGTIAHCLIEGVPLAEAMRAGARQGFEACTARGTTTALVGPEELRGHAAAA